MTRAAFLAAAGGMLCTLVGCGNQISQAVGSAGFNDDRPVKDKGSTSDDAGSDASAASSTDTDSSSSDKFDTWSNDCWDAHGNISVAALLELKGWQLQEFATQQGFAWSDTLEAYQNGDGRVLSVSEVTRDGDTTWLHEDAIGALDKGGVGSAVMYTLQVGGYAGPEDAISGITVPVEDRAQISSGSWIACVYGSNMLRHIVMTSSLENGDVSLNLITEDAIKTGRFTQGGGAPTIKDFWLEKTGRELG